MTDAFAVISGMVKSIFPGRTQRTYDRSELPLLHDEEVLDVGFNENGTSQSPKLKVVRGNDSDSDDEYTDEEDSAQDDQNSYMSGYNKDTIYELDAILTIGKGVSLNTLGVPCKLINIKSIAIKDVRDLTGVYSTHCVFELYRDDINHHYEHGTGTLSLTSIPHSRDHIAYLYNSDNKRSEREKRLQRTRILRKSNFSKPCTLSDFSRYTTDPKMSKGHDIYNVCPSSYLHECLLWGDVYKISTLHSKWVYGYDLYKMMRTYGWDDSSHLFIRVWPEMDTREDGVKCKIIIDSDSFNDTD